MMEHSNSELKTNISESNTIVDSVRDKHSTKNVPFILDHIYVLPILPECVNMTTAMGSELSRILRKSVYVIPNTTPRRLVDITGEQANSSPFTFPKAYLWSEERVGEWVSDTLGLSQYKEVFITNKISGSKLCYINASTLPKMNIHDFDDIKFITGKIRQELNVSEDKYIISLDLSQEDTLLKYLKFISGTGKKYAKATILECWRAMGVIQPSKPTPCHWFAMESSNQYPRTVIPSRRNIDNLCVPNPKYKHLELHSAL